MEGKFPDPSDDYEGRKLSGLKIAVNTPSFEEQYRETGRVVCGEILATIFIRPLAGTSYLGLIDTMDLSYEANVRSLEYCDWIIAPFKYPLW
jgi:hypothetical protein